MFLKKSKNFKVSREEHFDDLRPYQKKAVDNAYSSLISGKKKVLLEMATGTGKTSVMVFLTKRLFENKIIHKALILSNTRMEADQLASAFYKEESYPVTASINSADVCKIVIITYSKLINQVSIDIIKKFDLIVCDSGQNAKNEKIINLFRSANSMFVGVITSYYSKGQLPGWFSDTLPDFSYSNNEIERNGYFHFKMQPQIFEKQFVHFFSRLMKNLKYSSTIEPSINSRIYPDLLVSLEDKEIICEIKAYRSRNVSKTVLETAVEQILRYKVILESNDNPNIQHYSYCLIVLCEIDFKKKKQLYDEQKITILDISNILYLCQDYPDCLNEFTQILYFSITDIIAEEPYGWDVKSSVSRSKKIEFTIKNHVESFEELLNACKPGKVKRVQ